MSSQDTNETVEIIARVVGRFRNALDPFADLVKQVRPEEFRSALFADPQRVSDDSRLARQDTHSDRHHDRSPD